MRIPNVLKTDQNTAYVTSVPFIRTTVFFLVALCCFMCFTGCAKKTSDDVRIELEALDGREISESGAVFPAFVSNDEVFQKELDKLNAPEGQAVHRPHVRGPCEKCSPVHAFLV